MATNSPSEDTLWQNDLSCRFKSAQIATQTQIDQLKDSKPSSHDRVALIERCSLSITNLSNEIKTAASGLPAYDQRTYSTAIKDLTDQLASVRLASASKRRFAFKKKTATESPIQVTSNHDQDSGTDALREMSSAENAHSRITPRPSLEQSGLDFARQPIVNNGNSSLEIRVAGNDTSMNNASTILALSPIPHSLYTLAEKDLRPAVSVTATRNSLVDLSISQDLDRPFSTLAIQGGTDSLLVCGHVRGSAHITGIAGSTFVIWSQQVRMHECRNCIVYLRCSSKPIIEDCHDIRFSPLPDVFDRSSADPSSAPLSNFWNQVQDFNWLKLEPSPNWKILDPDDDRAINPADWKVITGKNALRSNLDDRLKAARILS